MDLLEEIRSSIADLYDDIVGEYGIESMLADPTLMNFSTSYLLDQTGFSDAFEDVTGFNLSNAFGNLNSMLSLQSVGSNLELIIDEGGNLIENLGAVVVDGVEDIRQEGANMLDNLGTQVGDVVEGVRQGIATLGDNLVEGASGAFGQLNEGIQGFVESGFESLHDILNDAASGILGWASKPLMILGGVGAAGAAIYLYANRDRTGTDANAAVAKQPLAARSISVRRTPWAS